MTHDVKWLGKFKEIANPLALKNCAGCRKPIDRGGYIVFAMCAHCLRDGGKTPLGRAILAEWKDKRK